MTVPEPECPDRSTGTGGSSDDDRQPDDCHQTGQLGPLAHVGEVPSKGGRRPTG